METNETLRKMREMKLLGMADAFAAQLADRLTYDALPAETRVGMLVDAELDRRQSTRLENLLKGARLRFPDARSEAVIYDPGRGLARDELARLFTCAYVGDGIDVVIVSVNAFLANSTNEPAPIAPSKRRRFRQRKPAASG